MDKARSSHCTLLCLAVKLYQVGPRCGLPLSLGMVGQGRVKMIKVRVMGDNQLLHQFLEHLGWWNTEVKWLHPLLHRRITLRPDMTVVPSFPHPLHLMIAIFLA